MAKKYELMVILSPTLDSEQNEAAQQRILDIINSNGTVGEVDDWGRRRLAYEIEDQTEGHYQVITFEAEAEAPREIERVLQIMNGVMRYMITLAEE